MWTGWYLQPDDVWQTPTSRPNSAILNPDFLFSTGNMSDITETEKTSAQKGHRSDPQFLVNQSKKKKKKLAGAMDSFGAFPQFLTF